MKSIIKRLLYFMLDLLYLVLASVGIVMSITWVIIAIYKLYHTGYLSREDQIVSMLCACILGTWGFKHRKDDSNFLDPRK